jgi:hypothetical protein
MTAVQPPTSDSGPSRLRSVLTEPFGIVIFGWGLALSVFAILILFIGLTLGDFGRWSFDEVARLAHPDANVDAVLVETNCGATTSFGYEVFLLPRGQKPTESDHAVASLYGAVRNAQAYGVNFRWTSNDTLVVEYLKAQHADWRNGSLAVNGRVVNIVMKSGVNDPAAPPGGMLYHLERRH